MRHALSLTVAVAALAFALPMAPVHAAEEPAPRQVAQAAADPVSVVEDFQAALVRAMRTDGFQARVDLLRGPITETFLLDVMARTVTGRHWRAAGAQEQQALVDAFGALTVANYAARFHDYDGQEFSVLGSEEGPRGTTIVHTEIKPRGKDATALSYVVGESGGRRGIVDVVVGGGVSQLATTSSEYSAILRRQGMSGLVETLKLKARELTEG